ncbi:unnamed protein product [Haemonchus placei]|uniref:Uncharacterized protein n=1 Tax=Haemonchus placei TaxID=6290 RepID=A0A3P7Z4H6_HAEPC|nr:unnamed protein product [Haemonchus placei]
MEECNGRYMTIVHNLQYKMFAIKGSVHHDFEEPS